MIKKKPSVTNAFIETIFPELAKDGFIKLNQKKYARLLNNEIVQWISIHVETRLRREYLIQYGITFLSCPQDSFSLMLGGNFSQGTSGGTYGANNDRMLEKSIQRALTSYIEEVRPIFNDLSSIESLITAYKDLIESKPKLCQTGHHDFAIACGYSILEKSKLAKKYCKISQTKYEKTFIENSNLDWAQVHIDYTKLLLSALNSDNLIYILESWRKYTIENLKLSKLCKDT